MERIIMHIDVNNAFLSWTAVDLLEKGYPIDIREIEAIIVGDKTKRSGIVLAKSPPAKKKGVVTAETIYSAKRKCPNLKMFPPNYYMYKEKSNSLFKLLSKYTPDIEVASIDECYLDYGKVKSMYGDQLEFAKNLQKEIFDTLKFTVNIGIANNKLCAKMASDFSKPNKIHTLYDYEVKEKMHPLPIEDLFGVGKQTSKKLRDIGINTIGDLANKKEQDLRRIFKNQAHYLIQIANGISNSEVDSSTWIPKGISNEITLEEDTSSIAELNKYLSVLSEMVSKRIRRENKYASTICVILKDSSFKRYSHQKKLKNPISSYDEIYKYSKEVLEAFYNNEPIRLIGIRLDNLKEEKNYQTSLFEEPKEDEIDKIMDSINNKYDKSVIKRASNIDNKRF
ncbi:MAG: DNA polymerase IV [Bacilli bacterium]|nr:DNA polymerase IV [Bacilli bacterium]